MALLEIEDLCKSFGALKATNRLSLTVEQGELHALIGPNGAGKTTLLGQLSGTLAADSGSIHFAGTDLLSIPAARRPHLGLVRSFQITSLFAELSVRDNVALAIQSHQGHSFRFWKAARTEESLREPAMTQLRNFGLEPFADHAAQQLSHGQQRQLELAMALALKPKLLLLDEPMAGMGPEESRSVVRLLQQLKGTHTMLLIEHDMDAVFAVADRVSVLVYGEIIATGTPDQIRDHSEVKAAYLGEHELPASA